MPTLKTNLTVGSALATILTLVSYLGGAFFGAKFEVNYLELFSVWTSFVCTYLCVMQSRWNYPIGAISVAALSLLFYQNMLYASMVLNVYLIPTLIYGWFRWRPDPDTRPVTHVELAWIPIYMIITVATWVAMSELSGYYGAPLAGPDSIILVGSIFAQFLLDNKKIETWIAWAIVNIFAIYTYWNAELYVLAFQFVFFLANTIYGYIQWNATMNKQERDYVEA